MKLRLSGGKITRKVLATLTLVADFALIYSMPSAAIAQRKTLSRKYPASRSVRISLKNSYGTITVEAWDRDEIKLAADMDSPSARVVPEVSPGSIEINVVRDNRGKE